jgi:septum formation protein
MLILASRSPRRADLLRAAGFDFVVRVADIDETPRAGELPRDYESRLAYEKAHAISAAPDEIVLAADTTVVVDNEILGKPEDAADAVRMLTALSGRAHEVITGICLRQGENIVRGVDVTGVWFSSLSPEEIEAYVASGEPMDKAGAYAIQGLASRFIPRIEGSYSNVVGLPVALVSEALSKLGK